MLRHPTAEITRARRVAMALLTDDASAPRRPPTPAPREEAASRRAGLRRRGGWRCHCNARGPRTARATHAGRARPPRRAGRGGVTRSDSCLTTRATADASTAHASDARAPPSSRCAPCRVASSAGTAASSARQEWWIARDNPDTGPYRVEALPKSPPVCEAPTTRSRDAPRWDAAVSSTGATAARSRIDAKGASRRVATYALEAIGSPGARPTPLSPPAGSLPKAAWSLRIIARPQCFDYTEEGIGRPRPACPLKPFAARLERSRTS